MGSIQVADALCLNPLELFCIFGEEKPIKDTTEKINLNVNGEEINISAYAIIDGVKTPIPYDEKLQTDKSFGYTFNETKIKEDIKTKENKDFDKKVYFEIEGIGEYTRTGEYIFAKDLPTPFNTLGLRNRRTLDFSDIFSKDVNLYNYSLQEIDIEVCDAYEQINETVCEPLDNGTESCFNQTVNGKCLISHIEVINQTIQNKRDFSYSFNKEGDKWIMEFYNLFDLDPSFTDNLDSDFGAGTLWRTNITPSANGGANVTLNYTTHVLKGDSGSGSMSAGQRIYNITGNFTSQVFDTTDTTSIFDKIKWFSSFPNSSEALGHVLSTDTDVLDSAVFYRNLTFAFNNSYSGSNGGSGEIGFMTGTSSYTIPTNINSDDIVGFAYVDDVTGQLYAFLNNGSILVATTNNLISIIDFTDILRYTIPSGLNTSDIIGSHTNTVAFQLFFKNRTIVHFADNTFSSPSTYSFTIPAGYSTENIIGAGFNSDLSDYILFLRNSSHLIDTSHTTYAANAVFTATNKTKYPLNLNITESTNITLQTRIGNTTPITNPYSTIYFNNTFLSDVDVNNNLGRYWQYKAIFTTPDKYKTPILENVSVNYTTTPTPPEPIATQLSHLSLKNGRLSIKQGGIKII